MVREWMLRNVIRVCPKSGRFVGFRFKHRWLWPIVGMAALAWFLVRVIPKPTRATYPCQQWVAPVAAGFLGWLLSLIGATWAFRKVGHFARQNRFVVASAFFLLGLGAFLWNACSVSGDAAASVPTDLPNTPIGTARGIKPGRVVWSRDPDAAHWSLASGTHWWDPDQTDQGRVDAMLSQGLRNLTGTSSDSAAWDALFRSYNQRRGNGNIGYSGSANKKIVIKINQNPANQSNNTNYAKNGCNDENAITGNPHLIRALIGQLVSQAQAAETDITVYDASGLNRGWGGPRTIGDNIYQYIHPVYPGVHFMDGVGQQGREIAVWPSFESVKYVTGKGGDENKGKKIVQQVLNAGFMINMAIMKSHGDGPTLCAKNHYGTVDGQRHGPMYGNSSYYSNFVELMGHKDMGEKTVLFMVDAVYGSSGPNNVPSKWTKTPFNTTWPSSVFLSEDGVAIDSVGWDFLNAEFGMPQNTDYHLHDAAYVPGADGKKLSGVAYAPNVGSTTTIGSLGVHEHWNNATDRKYSRNLGTGSGIELVQVLPTQSVSCSITNPAQNATFNQGSNVAIQATASTGSGSITKVEFYRNGSLIGTDTDGSNGWSYTWTNAAWGNYALTAKAFNSGGNSATSAAVAVWVLRPPENPSNTVNGLDYQYYEGTWDVLPDFDALTAAEIGMSANIDMSVRNRDEYYGLQFRGFVQAPTDGVYHFYTTSDDGSKWLIGTTELVNNDGLHGMQERSGAIGLKAGKHAVTVTFFQKAGGQGLSVSWDGPGLAKQAIPNERLWREVMNQSPSIDSLPWANPNPVQMPNATTCSVLAVDDGLPNSPGALTYTWSKQSGLGTVTFGSNNGSTTANNCTASFSVAGEYVLRVTVSDGELTDSVTVTVTVLAPAGLPAPWKNQDAGSVGLVGSATYSGGAFTIKGGGADIWGTADAFHFVYQSLNGDGEIVARVASVQNTNGWAKTGVMMRETLAAGSKHAMMILTPANGLAFQYRATTDGASGHVSGGAATAPRWVKLTRVGDLLTGYASADGATWTTVGSATIPMAASIFIGMPVTAHNNAALCTSVLDTVTVKSTAPFSVKVNFQLAGAPVPVGYVEDSGAVFGDLGNGYSCGWNVSNSTTARDRNAANSPDQRYDTLQHLQKPENPNGVWEIAVPNGTYRVHVVSGDPGFIDSVFKLNVEGVLAIDGTPTAAQHWIEGTVTVTVSDGRLTVGNASGAANNKICFIEIDRQ